MGSAFKTDLLLPNDPPGVAKVVGRAHFRYLVELRLGQLCLQGLDILIKPLWLGSGCDSNSIVLDQLGEQYNGLGDIVRLRYTIQGLLQRSIWASCGGCQSSERSKVNAFLAHAWNILICALKRYAWYPIWFLAGRKIAPLSVASMSEQL